MDYGIFFSDEADKLTVRLPTNPEEISISSEQNNEEFNVIGSGDINIPSHVGLREVSFECEFPNKPLNYITAPNEFQSADFYIKQFDAWRAEAQPIRFVVNNGVNDRVNFLVTIEEMEVSERAGEEGDYYINFTLREYRHYAMKKMEMVKKPNQPKKVVATKPQRPSNPPKPQNKTYTVQKGDTLNSISRRFLGDGGRYMEIYNLNKNVIGANPALIHPKQVLRLP